MRKRFKNNLNIGTTPEEKELIDKKFKYFKAIYGLTKSEIVRTILLEVDENLLLQFGLLKFNEVYNPNTERLRKEWEKKQSIKNNLKKN